MLLDGFVPDFVGLMEKIHEEGIYEKPKVTRLLSQAIILSRMNRLLLSARNDGELFQGICDLLTRLDYIKFVWVGIVEKGSFDVRPVASAGTGGGYLHKVRITWDESEFGKGPTGTAIKTGRPVLMSDISETSDSRYDPWRGEATRRGFASSIAVPISHNEETIGALNVYSSEKNAFGQMEIGFLVEVAQDIAIGLKSLRLEEELKRTVSELREGLTKTVEVIALMSEARDPYTSGHQQRVSKLASAIARKMGLDESQVEGIRIAGLLHDVGKISVPIEILSKPGRLTSHEFSLIKCHPETGQRILEGVRFPWPVAGVILQHHERLDGSGYPEGLKGEDISLEARILGVADVVEAISSHCPYRPGLGLDRALEEIKEHKGSLYDPDVVEACIAVFLDEGFKFD